MISKFIFDKKEEIFYLGTNCLIISQENRLFNHEGNSIETWEFMEIFNKKKKFAKLMIIDSPSETIKIFSDNLFSRLLIEECKGDFCKYEFLEHLKGVLQIKKNEYPGQKELKCNNKLLGSIYSVHFISQNLNYFIIF